MTNIHICLPEDEEFYAIPSTSACDGITKQCHDVAMINNFLDRELEDWLATSVSDQLVYNMMEPKKVVPSFISNPHDRPESCPLTFSGLFNEEESGGGIDLKVSHGHGTRERNYNKATNYFPYTEESSAIDLRQNSVDPGRGKRTDESEAGKGAGSQRFREYQDKQWQDMFQGLLSYIQRHGHCCVPNTLGENPRLGRWVKRQRYQYKLLQQSKQSTLTASRVDALEDVGFVWDSHAALWGERLSELKEYRKVHGHCNVPSTYRENVQLSTWVKCQRRQYKIYMSDKKTSNLTTERIMALEKLGFEWDGRLVRSNGRQQLRKS